jgi:hypothetical protein
MQGMPSSKKEVQSPVAEGMYKDTLTKPNRPDNSRPLPLVDSLKVLSFLKI